MGLWSIPEKIDPSVFQDFKTLVFDADGKTALSSGGGGKIDIDAEDITVKSEKANSISEGGTISMKAGHVSLNQTNVRGRLNIQAGSLDTQGQLWVSPSGKVSLGTDTSPLGEATIDNLNTWGQVDLYARELTFEKRVSASRGEDLSPELAAKVTIHAVPEQKTTFVAGAITSNNASLTVESGKVVSDGVIQANSASRISLGSESTPLESLTVTGQSETSANALLRSYQANILVKASQVSISQPRGKEQYALSAFGGDLTIESDDIKIDGKISAGVIEDCFNGRTDNSNYRQDAFDSSLVIRSLSENGITQITGDILTYNDSEEQQNNVQISLSGEKSYLDGSIQNLSSKEKAISATKNGTTLNLSEGATWNVKGASAVQAINTENGATINTETHQTDITALNNNGTLDLNTSTGRAGQIAIGELTNTGTINLNLDSQAASELGGTSTEETAQNAAGVLKIGTDSNKTGYQINIAESEINGTIQARADENGNIIAGTAVEKENSVMSSLKNIAANNYLVFRSQTNDVSKRMGDLRTMPQNDGMWARAIAGQSEYKSIHNTYQTLQIGGDKRIGNFYVGGTASYTDGDGKLDNGSTDDKNYSFGLYGGWIADDGQYIDIIVKRHHTESDYDLHYTNGEKTNGSMDTSGTSVAIEYGWRLGIANTNYYIEPQAELIYGHLNSTGYTTSNGVRISQDAIKAAVGRAGIAAGWVSPEKTGSAYIKASVLHDWEGEAEIQATKGNNRRSYTEDMGGTWGEFALGGTWNINKNLAAYGEVETTAGNPVRTTYQVSGGIRYSF